MKRQLRLLIAALLAFYASSTLAVGLGEIDLKSALNQRFDAEIELTSIGDLESDEILANLASQEDFSRVGVERDYQLTDLRFTVRVREDGQYIVQITSNKPVIEPFLNFIVEAIWPTGRILREYTVLLDPPVFGADGIEKIDPVSASGGRDGDSGSTSSGRSSRMNIPPAPGGRGNRGQGGLDETGMTGQGDTLWTIAMQVRPDDSLTVQQTMLALQRANPEAFINNNINLLKAGYVLRIPDASEIRAESAEDALAEVQVQNEEFSDYRADEVTQLDARRTASRDSSSGSESEEGELRLLASDDRGRSSGSGGDGRVTELEDTLAVTKEDLDRARRANTELNVKLDDLGAQIETLDEMVKVRDNQLAALKAEVVRMQEAQAGGAAATPTPVQQQPAQSLLSNPMVLGGIGVALIALIAGVLIMMRKRKQSSDLEEDEFEVLLDEPEEELSLADDEDQEEEELELDEDEDVTQQTSDVIGEAEIYIAYGRFPQAISFLQNAIENEPDRADVQLKLLEVYVQTEDADAFNEQFEQLKKLGDSDATSKARALQAEIPGASDGSEADEDAGGEDEDMSFDLDDMDAETEDDDLGLDTGSDESEDLSLDEAMELGEADLELDLDAALEEAAEDEEDDALDMELSLDDDDLDLDFGSDDDALDLGGDDDAIELDLGDDDDDALDLGGDDDDAIELDLGDDDDDAIELDLGDDDDVLDLGDDNEIDLSGDDDLDLGDDFDLGEDFDLGDDDELDLGDLDLDDDTKRD